MSKKSIIIINGNPYDARTGALLTSPPKNQAHPTKSPAAAHPKTAKKAVVAKQAPSVKAHRRKPAPHAAVHTPHPAHTLMRQAVKKPSVSRPIVTAHNQLAATVKPLAQLVAKPSVTKLDSQRLQHAKRVTKSRFVSRFPADLFNGTLSLSTAAPQPVAATAKHHSARPVTAKTTKPRTTAELLEYALNQATSHQAKPLPAAKRRLFKRKARASVA